MSFMLQSDLVKALVLDALSRDVWHITVKTNLGSVEVDFSDDKFKVLLGSVDEGFAKLLVDNGYKVEVKPFIEKHTITLEKTLKSTTQKYRVKYTKRFIKLLKRYERSQRD
jgi:hypothetical protein